MFGPTGIVLAPVMGQHPSAIDTESVRRPSTTIFREDLFQIQEEAASRSSSWTIHCDRTDQAPYTDSTDDKMMTSTNILHVPKGNPSHDLAYFLRNTGPIAPHRRPSTAERPPRGTTAPQKALRFFGIGQKRPAKANRDRYKLVLRDEGGLLIPDCVEQKQTSTGMKYLALPAFQESTMSTPVLGADILESEVSVQFAEEMHQSEVWRSTPSSEKPVRSHAALSQLSTTRAVSNDGAIRLVMASSSPIRPPATNPPTPQPDSAISTLAGSYMSDLDEHPAKRSFDAARALSSHPVHSARSSPSFTALPKIPLPNGGFPLKPSAAKKEIEIKHPSPRRFASHTVLLQRASSIASPLNPRSVSDSPGPPPPRSPLRLRRDPRTIENIIACHPTNPRKSTPRLAPSIKSVEDFSVGMDLMKPTIITDCTGPIKRPRSRGKNSLAHPAYPSSRKEREERVRARKVRERTQPTRTIDAVVNEPPSTPRHRLRKARPHIHIPDLRPAPLVTRASSSASSNTSWKKVTEYTRTPVSPVPSQDSPASHGEKTGYTPVSPTTSNENRGSSMALSPVMLVAEEIPVPKAKSTPKPARLVLREGKSYAPRPRSASLSRNAINRRSRNGGTTTSGSHSSGTRTPARSRSPPPVPMRKEDTPPLPSPPPNRALPPTPPASGSEKAAKGKVTVAAENTSYKKDIPLLPAYDVSPLSISPTRPEHIVNQQVQRRNAVSKADQNAKVSRIDARLEAVERQNALLSAALMAVLKTNGSLNGAPSLAGLADPESPKTPLTAWQTRIARRSAASHHAPSSSNESALEMYMSTRRGSKQYR